MYDIKEICVKLWNYKYKQTNPIVIVAPDFGKNTRKKLRVYANGGCLGRLSFGKGKSELLNTDYDEYLLQKGKLKEIIDLATKNHTENNTFISPAYLENAIEAIEAKFSAKEKKDTVNAIKERYIETAIVRKHMKSNMQWSVIDMETQFPKNYFLNATFSKGTTKSPRFDLIVINETGFGIVELKVNNENCNNMQSHYEHMTYVLKYPEKFRQEFQRRLEILKKFELINQETVSMYKKLLDYGEIPLWCGFLFVGGKKEDTLAEVKKLGINKQINDLKFMYYDSFDIKDLDINQMVSYNEFVK